MRTLSFISALLLSAAVAMGQTDVTVKEWTPQSMYKIPVTKIGKAKYPVIDAHSHVYNESAADLKQWVASMDEMGIERTVVLTGMVGRQFDSIIDVFAPYKDRFDLWCGLDFSDYGKPSFSKTAIKELQRCHKKGAKGVGELTDKGLGVYLAFQPNIAKGVHLNDVLMTPIYNACAELKMPLNVHVAEPIWMYIPNDKNNEGLPNGEYWAIDLSNPDMLNHEQMIATFEDAVKKHPKTTFIACHFINCSYDLSIVGRLLEAYPNLYVDNSARFGETGSIPRYMHKFYKKYADRILYGTDNGMSSDMYRTTFRFLETDDEHFYVSTFGYRWNFSGYHLPDDVLKKVYRDNALKVLK